MAVNYNTTIKNARMQAAVNGIDGGPGVGILEICSAAYATVLATIPLQKPSFTVVAAVMTMTGAPRSDVSADATGTAAVARIKDSTGTVQIDGLVVGVGSGEVQLNSVAIGAGQTVTINSGTITHG